MSYICETLLLLWRERFRVSRYSWFQQNPGHEPQKLLAG